MFRSIPLGLLAAGLLIAPAVGHAQQTKPAGDKIAQLIEKVKANPDDMKAINQLMQRTLSQAFVLSKSDAEKAAAVCARVRQALSQVKPTKPNAKTLHGRAVAALEQFEQRFAVAGKSLDELKKRAIEQPTAKHINQYVQKVMLEVGPSVRSAPSKAEVGIKAAKEFLASIKEKNSGEEVQQAIAKAMQQLARYDSMIADAKRLQELIGQPAAKIDGQVEAWVNGKPLTDDDLKGKVVVLDFWAVWCGPCIATFPHLKEWHDKYADKGLVIIGLTRNYGYEWNADRKRAMRAKPGTETNIETEKAMLEKFLEHHGLKHRIAIQTKDSKLAKFYGVTGIPHVVVIDRKGKVRLFRVGSGQKNAHDIEQMIEKLIGEAT